MWRFAGCIKIGDLMIDAVAVGAAYHWLLKPRQEFQLLKFLAERTAAVQPQRQASRVPGYRYAGGTRTVDIHVRRLRAKLGLAAHDRDRAPRRLQAARAGRHPCLSRRHTQPRLASGRGIR
jgi:DNA-binding response OmpR family regulator